MTIKVLIVDDEKAFAAALAERLHVRQMEAEAVFSGEDALERLEAQGAAVDVVVLDVLMPGIGGIETLREIKQRWPLVEVVMLTGHATVETAIEGMKLGAHDYLMKPCETEVLVDKLNKARKIKRAHEKRIQEAEIDAIVKRRGW